MRIVTDLGIGSAPVRPRRSWNPAWLFQGGAQGAWYDPGAEGVVWRDTAGTLPALPDDPVARIDDLSGNGNHATQATVAARPILRTDGAFYWLEFDGVDDALVTTAVNFPGDSLTMIAAAEKASATTTQLFMGLGASVRFYINRSSSVNRVSILDGSGERRGAIQNGIHRAVASGTVDRAAGVVVLRENGVASNQSQTGAPPSGNFGSLPIALGATSGGALILNGKFFGSLVRLGVLPEAGIAGAEAWLAERSGMTL